MLKTAVAINCETKIAGKGIPCKTTWAIPSMDTGKT